MKKFNLSDWALKHRSLVWYLMAVSLIAGIMAYVSIGREEDPDFTIKTMIISAAMPGATVEEMRTQVTDRIEKKLEELDELDFTRSITRPGQAIVYVDLLPTTKARNVPGVWQHVRNMMNDIRPDFPKEFAGFQFNDNFGDVFGNIYAFTSDGFSPREVRDHIEAIKRDVQQLDDAGKIEIFGTREEVVYLEFSPARLAALGIDQRAVQATLAAQNAIVPSGVIVAGPERVLVRVSGQFLNTKSLRDINLRVGGRFFRLSDVAEIRRGYKDPPSTLFRYNAQPALGLSVGMRKGGNIINFGRALDAVIARDAAALPVGISIAKVADQPAVVNKAVGHFTRALFEAVAIVLAVSFISLGVRAGIVVTLSIPLVLAITFFVMDYLGFTLQRISLGGLIIALGLLVDDAMITIESMISRLEAGDSRRKAASFAWTSIAFPMLTGTLVTVAGFIPIGLNNSAAGEFTFSLFVVISVALLFSWLVAVLFSPLIGATMLPRALPHHNPAPGWLRRGFHGVLRSAMRFRWLTIALTLAAFAYSIYAMRYVEKQFFPQSDRPELIVDFTLPQNASIAETRAQMARLEDLLKGRDEVKFFSSYVGRGAPRFLLAFDVPTPGRNMGQMIIQTKSIPDRNRLRADLKKAAATDFAGVDVYVKLLAIGPPVGRPVQYRLSGPDIGAVRDLARDLAAVMATDPRLTSIVMDWNEPSRVVRLDILQDKARQLGITGSGIASALNTIYAGQRVTRLRDSTYLIDIVTRGSDESRHSLDALYNLQLSNGHGGAIPLSSIAQFRYETEQPVIHQRDRMPTITVKAAIATKDQPATIVAALAGKIAAFDAGLPAGYHAVVGGTVEKSAESQAPIKAVVPLMILVMMTLTMIQTQSFRLTFIALSVAPLGLIGVVAALVPSGAPLGFVAILGVLALAGILIRNAIILLDQIETLRAQGLPAWEAVFKASDQRARPILLTAAAASLALIPISRQIFWGPMAYAMMGGIIAGTIITLVFAPALYLAVFRVKRPR